MRMRFDPISKPSLALAQGHVRKRLTVGMHDIEKHVEQRSRGILREPRLQGIEVILAVRDGNDFSVEPRFLQAKR